MLALIPYLSESSSIVTPVYSLNEPISSIFSLFWVIDFLNLLLGYLQLALISTSLVTFYTIFWSLPPVIEFYDSFFSFNQNALLLNKLNLIHPPLFTILTIVTLFYYKGIVYRSLLISWLVPIFFLSLGGWWAYQESTWGGWWNNDLSELLALAFFLIPLFLIHDYKKFKFIEIFSCIWFFLITYMFVQVQLTSLSHDFGLRLFIPPSLSQIWFELFIISILLGFFHFYQWGNTTFLISNLNWILTLLALAIVVFNPYTLAQFWIFESYLFFTILLIFFIRFYTRGFFPIYFITPPLNLRILPHLLIIFFAFYTIFETNLLFYTLIIADRECINLHAKASEWSLFLWLLISYYLIYSIRS